MFKRNTKINWKNRKRNTIIVAVASITASLGIGIGIGFASSSVDQSISQTTLNSDYIKIADSIKSAGLYETVKDGSSLTIDGKNNIVNQYISKESLVVGTVYKASMNKNTLEISSYNETPKTSLISGHLYNNSLKDISDQYIEKSALSIAPGTYSFSQTDKMFNSVDLNNYNLRSKSYLIKNLEEESLYIKKSTTSLEKTTNYLLKSSYKPYASLYIKNSKGEVVPITKNTYFFNHALKSGETDKGAYTYTVDSNNNSIKITSFFITDAINSSRSIENFELEKQRTSKKYYLIFESTNSNTTYGVDFSVSRDTMGVINIIPGVLFRSLETKFNSNITYASLQQNNLVITSPKLVFNDVIINLYNSIK